MDGLRDDLFLDVEAGILDTEKVEAEIERLRAVPEAAAKEIEAYVAETVKQWVNFHGHESEIAAIIRKHAGATPEQSAPAAKEG